jgi:hypothetical protein
VQLANYFDADVTALCNTKNVELVRSLGANRVIDHTQEDFTKNSETYDFIFDAVGKLSFKRCRGSLKPGGMYGSTDLGPYWQNPFLALWMSRIGDKKVLPRGDRPALPVGGRGRGEQVRGDEEKTGNVVLTLRHDRTN